MVKSAPIPYSPLPPTGAEEADDAEIAAYVKKSASTNLDSVSSLSAFVRQMERYPILTAEQALHLTQVAQRGRSAKEAVALGTLSKKALREAHDAIKQGERAMEHLLGSSVKLVLLIARENAEKRLGQARALSVLPDLVSDCMASLTKAVYEYDPARCPTFSTYAARIARDTARMALTNDSLVHLPASWVRVRRIAAVHVPMLTSELGRSPTQEEIHEELLSICLDWAENHLSEDEQKVKGAKRTEIKLSKLRKQGMLGALENLDKILAASNPITSLDISVGEEGGATLGDLVSVPSDAPLFDNVENNELRSSIDHALSALSERERDIIILRFDLNDTGEQWTYNKIAKRYNITAERIRQIERNVLTKMSTPHGQFGDLSSFLPSQMDNE